MDTPDFYFYLRFKHVFTDWYIHIQEFCLGSIRVVLMNTPQKAIIFSYSNAQIMRQSSAFYSKIWEFRIMLHIIGLPRELFTASPLAYE